MIRLFLALALCSLLGACATSVSSPPPPAEDGQRSPDRPPDLSRPDRSRDVRAPDRRVADRGASDRPRPDLRPPDRGSPDASNSCGDTYEPDEDCPSAASAGSVLEGTGWATLSATLDPASDWDWFMAIGVEATHSCFPFASQCYTFTVQVQVPAGRSLRLCLHQDSCTAAASCTDSPPQASAAHVLELKYQVDGTCVYTDDSTAKISLQSLDGKGGCAPYTLSFRYDEC